MNRGEEILLCEITKNSENILVHHSPMEEDLSVLILRSTIFSKEGVSSLTPKMFLTYKEKFGILEIADIRMEDNDTNKGYGSVLMGALSLIIQRYPRPIKYITGWISGVDWDHVDRNKHFYEKFGFCIELDHSIKEGAIFMINPSNNGSNEYYNNLNYTPGIAGLLS